MNADLILTNFKSVSFTPNEVPEEIIAINEDKIVYVGPRHNLHILKGPRTRIFDCNNGVVVPGFNDAHCHPIALAVSRLHADCTYARCIIEMRNIVANYISDHRPQHWVHAVNCDFEAFSDSRLPNRYDIDFISSEIPILVLDRTGQRCVLNTPALYACGIDKHSSDLDGSIIYRDPDSGEPTGLIEGNDERITRAIPPISVHELSRAAREASRHLLSFGITSVQDTSWTNSLVNWKRIGELKENGDFLPRLTLMPGVDFLDEFIEAQVSTGSGDNQLRIGAVKIALDESSGNKKPPQELINQAALDAHQAGFQLAFHVPDIYLLNASMQALEYVRQHSSEPVTRPRFEHCPVCPPQLIPLVARSGASIVTQPNLLHETGERYLKELADDQLPWVYPLRSFASHGINIAFSSDSPLTNCNPLQAISTAVTRTVRGGDTLLTEERLLPRQALKMYTETGSYLSMEENVKGSIAPGMLADLVVLKADYSLFDHGPHSGINAVATFLGGRLVWEKSVL